MENELKKTIDLVEKINLFIKCRDTEFDKEDVIDTFKSSKKRLISFLQELEIVDLKEKEAVNKLLVHTELEYANFVWSFNEIRNFIKRAVINFPD